MEILIVIPKYIYNHLGKEPNYNYFVPIGMGYISSVLKKEGYSVNCLNLNHFYGTVDEILNKELNSKKYDTICTGGMAINYAIIEKIINISRAHKSNPLVIVGGQIITSEPELMIKSLGFDIGVIGEGEETIIELMRCIEKNGNLKNVEGICYKDKENIIITEERKPTIDLDKIPYPDLKAIEYEKVLDKMACNDVLFGALDYPRVYILYGSRGCPFNCTFCYHLEKKYRQRSINNIIEEIKFAIDEYKINSFILVDDLFSVKKERLIDFCGRIKELNKKVDGGLKWRCSLWVGGADREVFKTLKEAGCCSISCGFESYSPIVLKSMKKPITPSQIDNVIKLSIEYKIPLEGNFIFGDLAETKETAKETLDYWEKNCEGQVKLFFIHPYPDSEIYISCVKRKIIKDKLEYIKNYIHHTNIINMTNKMNNEDFEWLKKEVYRLKKKYEKSVIPKKIKKSSGGRYKVYAKCPFCGVENVFKNCRIANIRYYSLLTTCRECRMKYYIMNRLYKFTSDHYLGLDFLRKTYLIARDNFLKRKL